MTCAGPVTHSLEPWGLLDQADLVRPQNYFCERPWHARWDTGRTLLNRSVGADYPGTYALRRSTFLSMGGYDGDVLFENLELSRTVRAVGGREQHARSIFVARVPPTSASFRQQRVRQAYDDLAQPLRLTAEAALLPALGLVARRLRGRYGRSGLPVTVLATAALAAGLAEVGRRRDGGVATFPASSALWAPVWLFERAVCVWIALGRRLTGGMPYREHKLVTAAHSLRKLRKDLADRFDGASLAPSRVGA